MELSPEQRADEWTPMASGYDEVARPFTERFASDTIDLLGIQEGDRLLDIAAGTGAVTIAAANAGADVLATDFSPGMLAVLAGRLQGYRLSKVKLEVMNGQDLAVDDEAFDYAVSNFGLMMFPDRAAGFREMYRVLKPGGRASVAVWGPMERLGFFQLMMGAAQQAVPDLPPPAEPPAWLELTDPHRLRAMMLEAGFGYVNIYTVAHVWPIDSPEWLRDRVEGIAPGLKFVLDKMTDEQRAAFRNNVAAGVRGSQHGGPYALTGEAHIAVAVKV